MLAHFVGIGLNFARLLCTKIQILHFCGGWGLISWGWAFTMEGIVKYEERIVLG